MINKHLPFSSRTFLVFGLTIYLIGFLSLIHFYRIRKDHFRADFGYNFIWPTIGTDFKYLYDIAQAIKNPEEKSSLETEYRVYPPWASISYIPFTLFSLKTAYRLFSLLLLAALIMTIFLCLSENSVFQSIEITLFFALICTTIFYHTYPVLFAIERGNFDILAGFFSALGLFSLSRGFRKAAVITLSIATQYKLYPFILGSIVFVRLRWKFLAAFILMNIAMLVIQGPKIALKYIAEIKGLIAEPNLWPGNHSLASFAKELVRLQLVPEHSQDILSKGFTLVAMLLFLCAFIWVVLKKTPSDSSPFSVSEAGLIGMAFCIMSLIPSTSHDYKLPIHIVPYFLINTRNKTDFTISKYVNYVLIALLSLSLAFLLVPFFLTKTLGIIANLIVYGLIAAVNPPSLCSDPAKLETQVTCHKQHFLQ